MSETEENKPKIRHRKHPDWKPIFVHTKTLEFLKELRDRKGYRSLEEVIFNSCKALEFHPRGLVIQLAEISVDKVETASSEEEMYRKLGKKQDKDETGRFGLTAGS